MELSAEAAAPRIEERPDLSAGAPLAVRDIDLWGDLDALRLPASQSGRPYRGLVAMLRAEGEPLGWVSLGPVRGGEVSLAPLRDLRGDCEPAARLAAAPRPTRLDLSVVVTTCADPDATLNCVAQIVDSADCEVVVVENRPAGSAVAAALRERFGSRHRIRYVEEPMQGLGRARNAGLRVAVGRYIAFTDDDVVVDPAWAMSLLAAFSECGEVDCVSGLILPLEFETEAQILIERFAGFAKGFRPRTYALATPPPDQPLFPYTPGYMASGANMAFRTDFLRQLGGFDPYLGTGTATRGGEDLDVCIRLLQAGGRLAYAPRAIVWHRHPDSLAALRQRAFGYGMGLGAALGKQLLRGPGRLRMLALSRRGLRYFLDPRSRKNAGRSEGFSRLLKCLEALGLALGPAVYFLSLLKPRRQ